jgi:hypothetical protein
MKEMSVLRIWIRIDQTISGLQERVGVQLGRRTMTLVPVGHKCHKSTLARTEVIRLILGRRACKNCLISKLSAVNHITDPYFE